MDTKNVTIFDGIFAGVLLLALGLRVVFIGDWVLSEKEAALAIQASGSPLTFYQVWTGLLFHLFGTSEFLARLWPVLFGTLFVFSPLMLRKHLGDAVTLIIAFGLAIDPGLLALSKQAGPEMLAISTFFFLILSIWQKKWALAGVSLAIGLLSGAYFWIGLLALILCLIFGLMILSKIQESSPEDFGCPLVFQILRQANWKAILTAGGFTVLLAGTFFLTQPQALAGITASILEIFERQSLGLQAITFSVTMIGFLSMYSPLLILGLLGLRLLSNGSRILLWTWMMFVFILINLLPGRQLVDLIWLILPLYIPAALVLSRFQHFSDEKPALLGAVVATLSVFALYFMYSFSQYLTNPRLIQANSQPDVYLLGAVISFIIFVMILVVLAWGWSIAVSLDAVRLLGLGMLILMMVFSAMKSTGFDSSPSQLMWFQTRYFEDRDIFMKTIQQLDQNRSEKNAPLRIQIQMEASNSLLWELRDYDLIINSSKILSDELQADVIITGINVAPLVAENRAGQDFILERSPAWSLMSFQEWYRWVLFQEPQYNNLQIVTWMNPYDGSLEVSSES
jgi:hypothetical protein